MAGKSHRDESVTTEAQKLRKHGDNIPCFRKFRVSVVAGVKRGNLCAEQYQEDSNPSKDDMAVRQKYPKDRLERVGC